MNAQIEGQLSLQERELLTSTIRDMPVKPRIVVEVGTWLGGGSTLHILRALHENGEGHLWGVEACKDVYEKMITNISAAIPEAAARFTPLFGLSDEVLPGWLDGLPAGSEIDLAFLDGGDNPLEQIHEFELLAPRIKTGGVLMGHDARMRKGKWLCPYVALLDNWKSQIFDYSHEGLFHAVKTGAQPSETSRRAAARKLRGMRLEPVELLGSILPGKANETIMRVMPKSLRKMLFKGRR